MSAFEIARLVVAGSLVLGVLFFLSVMSVAAYLDLIRPHLAERRKKGKITGIRLVVEREPEVKEYYRRPS